MGKTLTRSLLSAAIFFILNATESLIRIFIFNSFDRKFRHAPSAFSFDLTINAVLAAEFFLLFAIISMFAAKLTKVSTDPARSAWIAVVTYFICLAVYIVHEPLGLFSVDPTLLLPIAQGTAWLAIGLFLQIRGNKK